MIANRLSPLDRITCVYSCCSASRLVSARRLAMPITPFIGVRIS